MSTVTLVGPDGREVESTEAASCAICGVEGLRGDFPGMGGIVSDERGDLVCDACADAVEAQAIRDMSTDAGEAGDPVGKMRLQRVRLDRGGYDPGGGYWGVGQPLYRYQDSGDELGEGEIDGYIRANDRGHAKSLILAKYPTARFYR